MGDNDDSNDYYLYRPFMVHDLPSFEEKTNHDCFWKSCKYAMSKTLALERCQLSLYGEGIYSFITQIDMGL